MNDEAHAKLLGMLAEQRFAGASLAVCEELLHFFSEPDTPYATKRNVKAWATVQVQLEQLKAAPPQRSNRRWYLSPDRRYAQLRIRLSGGLARLFRAEFLARCASRVRKNDPAGGTKVFTIAQTPAFVAASIAPDWELDGYCAGEVY